MENQENQELYAVHFEKPAVPAQTDTIKRIKNINLNPTTARQAMILHEIIGPPVAKRKRVR